MKSILLGLLAALLVVSALANNGNGNGHDNGHGHGNDVSLSQYEQVSVNLGDVTVKVYHNKQIFPHHHKEATIFFVHGNSASHKAFEKQLTNKWLNRRYNLYAVDLPGHGASTFSTNPNFRYTLTGYADFMKGVVTALGLTNTVFVGWSLGGHILIESFLREEVFRQAAAGLVIHGTPPISTAADIPPAFLWANPGREYFATQVVTPAQAKVAATSEFSLNVENNVPHSLDHVIDEWTQVFLASDPVARYVVNNNAIGDEVGTVENLMGQTPLAILHGREDQLVNATYIETLVPHIPTLWEGEIHYIELAGHSPFWQQEDDYNSLLREFVHDVYHHHH